MELFHAIAGLAVATVIFVYGVVFAISLCAISGVYFTSSTGGGSSGDGPDRAEFKGRMVKRGVIAACSFAAVTVPIALLISFS